MNSHVPVLSRDSLLYISCISSHFCATHANLFLAGTLSISFRILQTQWHSHLHSIASGYREIGRSSGISVVHRPLSVFLGIRASWDGGVSVLTTPSSV